MIKIDLVTKLSKLGVRLVDFEDKYIKTILDYEHQIVTNSNGRKLNRFSLPIDLVIETSTKYKLERIFFDLYNDDDDLRRFIDSIFYPLITIEQARELLKEIFIMRPDDMEIKKEAIDRYIHAKPNNLLKKIFNYKRDRERKDITKGIAPRFKEIDFRVCIYCNRNFISNFHTKKVTRATFTLDHFYQKEKYPLFSLSLYNLIPSCAVCNTNIKGARDVEQYKNPYSNDYNFENEAKFRLMPHYKVKLITNNLSCRKYISDFYHNEVYETHTMEVKAFVKRREVFTEDMIKKLSNLTKHSESRIKAFLFGDVLYKKIIDTESLGKLKVDMAEELKII